MRRSLLLICVSLIIGYVVGSRANQKISESPISDNNVTPGLVRFFNEPVLDTAGIEVPDYGLTIADAEPLWSLPEEPSDKFPKGNIHGIRPFIENEGLDGNPQSSQIDDSNRLVNLRTKEIDIDEDGIAEQAMFNDLYLMSNEPHLIRIVKDGMVVFEFQDQMVNIEKVYGNKTWGGDEYQPGFVVTTNMWQDKSGYRVRYVVDKDGTIKPLWQQRHAGLGDGRNIY